MCDMCDTCPEAGLVGGWSLPHLQHVGKRATSWSGERNCCSSSRGDRSLVAALGRASELTLAWFRRQTDTVKHDYGALFFHATWRTRTPEQAATVPPRSAGAGRCSAGVGACSVRSRSAFRGGAGARFAKATARPAGAGARSACAGACSAEAGAGSAGAGARSAEPCSAFRGV